MLSSMTPTILARDGEPVAVIGSPGGRTIINTVLQIVVNVVDFRMSPADAVASKRLHHQWLPDVARLEDGYMSETDAAALAAMGHEIAWSARQGIAHCIFVDRRHGSPGGGARPARRGRDGCGALKIRRPGRPPLQAKPGASARPPLGRTDGG